MTRVRFLGQEFTGIRTYAKDDVAELDDNIAKEFVAAKRAVLTDDPVTPIPEPESEPTAEPTAEAKKKPGKKTEE